ncbi:unnamed protein product [Urochloa decumbens]|uniref:BTB domain-containing protein n=1 Tax=Urochloa decumbens TaxID=240449 RepID=A0ABC9BK61_9POAL
MLDSRFVEFKLDYTKTKNLPIGSVLRSGDIAAGGHLWRFNCYPRGRKIEDSGEHLSVFLELVSTHSKNVRAIFDAFAVNRDGAPSWWCDSMRRADVYPARGAAHGRDCFVARSFLESLYTEADGWVTVTCGVIVVLDGASPPPPDIGAHLGRLLDDSSGDGDGDSDVTFVVGGETFRAHRLVLAARSPVFKAQLRGSMADATMDSITVHDIAADTFRIMLRFVYTDALPKDEEMGYDSLVDTTRRLLAAADRFALDRLKVLCDLKLRNTLSADTVAATLACAQTYSCVELKNRCMAFLADAKNLEAAILTEGFTELVRRHPSFVATFAPMLQVMYPDAFRAGDDDEEEIGDDSPTVIFERLLATADHHGLEWLKLVCAQILWDNVTVDTVATTLARAEMYTCPELKRKCIGFFAAKKNFKKAVLTRGFVQLGQRFPSVIDELRERVVGLRL